MSVHLKYISKIQTKRYNVFSIYLFLQIALHVSGGSSAHHQEHKTVHTALGIVKTILLSAALVDEMEFVNLISSTIAAGNIIFFDNAWPCMYSFVILMMGGGNV
jgi:hypothetical protein